MFATAKDHFRKPETGMWQHLVELNKNVTPDPRKSFFVGDASGRDSVRLQLRAKSRDAHLSF